MNSDQDLFEITLDDFYRKAKKDFNSFIEEPSDDRLLNVLFSFNHLRDWIYPPGCKAYKEKDENQLSKEEKFHKELYENADYDKVRQLCNRAKHVNKRTSLKTEFKQGFLAGIGRAGDRVDGLNYLVDDQDLRVVLENVFELYRNYFEPKQSN
jgi:hypothetical protein